MYGKSVQCDVCDRIDFVDTYIENRSTFFDAGFDGWIRVTLNKPRDYGWTFRDPRYSTIVMSVDCCSIECARKILTEAYDLIPEVIAERAERAAQAAVEDLA